MTDHAAFLARRRFEPLDGIRCLSVLPVIAFHAAPSAPSGIVARGPLGVDMFFALSGFLITTLLLRQPKISLVAFWERRVRRIFPLYYVVLAAYALYAACSPPSATREHFFRSLPFYATYTTNCFVNFQVEHPVLFAFSWSLAVEEQFYLVWPPLLALLRGRAVVFMVVAVVFRLCPAPIALGAMLAIVLHHPVGFALLGRWLQSPLVKGVLALLAVSTFLLDVPLLVTHAGYALLVAAAAVGPGYTWLNAAPLRFVGDVSYGVYLLHVSGIALVHRLGFRETWTVFGLGTLVTLVVATASRRWLERPLLQAKRTDSC